MSLHRRSFSLSSVSHFSLLFYWENNCIRIKWHECYVNEWERERKRWMLQLLQLFIRERCHKNKVHSGTQWEKCRRSFTRQTPSQIERKMCDSIDCATKEPNEIREGRRKDSRKKRNHKIELFSLLFSCFCCFSMPLQNRCKGPSAIN